MNTCKALGAKRLIVEQMLILLDYSWFPECRHYYLNLDPGHFTMVCCRKTLEDVDGSDHAFASRPAFATTL